MTEWAWIVGLATFLLTLGITLFAAGRWVGASEERMKLHTREQVAESERTFRDQLHSARTGFDETLKGLRQKINDVQEEILREYVAKKDWNEFRKEFREDMKSILAKLDHLQSGK